MGGGDDEVTADNLASKLDELLITSGAAASADDNRKGYNPFKEDSDAFSARAGTSEWLPKQGSNSDDVERLDLPIPVDPLKEKGVFAEDKLSALGLHMTNEPKGAQFYDGSSFKSQLPKPMLDDISPGLYKASSVPHLHTKSLKLQPSGSPRRKKTSEANGLPDPLLFAQLKHENQVLKERLISDEEDRKRIVGINHAWDSQYNVLKQKCATLDQETKQLKEESVNKDKEMEQKDKKIARLMKKLESSICIEVEKNWKKDTNETGMNMERSDDSDEQKRLMQQIQELNMKCQFLEKSLTQQTQQKLYLQSELKRLSSAIESRYNPAHTNTSANENGTLHHQSAELPVNGNDKNEVELLKQQIQIYAEDFNAERDEKQKLLREIEELKKKIGSFNEEKEHILRQLRIYEEDFHREREKRIDLMRRTGTFPRDELASSRASEVSSPILHRAATDNDAQRKWKEYCCLVVEKETLNDRINELESQGVTRYNGRTGGQSYQQYHHLPRGPQIRTSSATSSPTRQPQLEPSNYYSGNVMRDGRVDWPQAMYMSANRTPSESDNRPSSLRPPLGTSSRYT